MIEDELTRTRLQKDSALRDKTSIEAKLTRELEEWRVRAEELADYSEEQVSKYGVREERRRADEEWIQYNSRSIRHAPDVEGFQFWRD